MNQNLLHSQDAVRIKFNKKLMHLNTICRDQSQMVQKNHIRLTMQIDTLMGINLHLVDASNRLLYTLVKDLRKSIFDDIGLFHFARKQMKKTKK